MTNAEHRCAMTNAEHRCAMTNAEHRCAMTNAEHRCAMTKMRQNKNLVQRSDSVGSERALAPFHHALRHALTQSSTRS